MSLAKVFSAQLTGLISEIITIEVDITRGLHSFSVIGLGDRAVEESKDRISGAIKNSGFESPKQKNQKIVISLAPAYIRKEGPSFDLGMAIAYLIATDEIEIESSKKLFFGELSLEGELRRVDGILPIICQAKDQGFDEIFIPKANAEEASLAENITIYPAENLKQVIDHLIGIKYIENVQYTKPFTEINQNIFDMKDVRGNENVKRGLEIAASGAHNVIMCGIPGTGKTMLAQTFPSILPDLSYKHAVEVISVHSVAKNLDRGLSFRPPFRSPHHTASYPSIIGGGGFPKPGEITLAHRGVLFLDEFLEFDSNVIESLRQPLEDRKVTISRAKGTVTFPAQFILIASMNPCPCGKGKANGCSCSLKSLDNYKKKLSGPIVDRIDIWLNVNKVDYEKLGQERSVAESSETIKKRVVEAREIQNKRFSSRNLNISFNSEMSSRNIEELVKIDSTARSTLVSSAKKMGLSGRSFHRTIKVAQTIADLEKSPSIENRHILEALQYRKKL